MRKFLLLIVSGCVCFDSGAKELKNWIRVAELSSLKNTLTSESNDQYYVLGQYPILGEIQKIKANSEGFETEKICDNSFKINVLALKYGPNDLSPRTRKKYFQFLKKKRHELSALKSQTKNLPESDPCPITLNGTKGTADMSALIFYDLTEGNRIRLRIFQDFQTNPAWAMSISLAQSFAGDQKLRGLQISKYAAPSIEKNAEQWSYFSVDSKPFEEVATATFKFNY